MPRLSARLAPLAALVLTGWAASARAEAPQELDRVVAVVRAPASEPRVVTLSEVEDAARFALVSHGGALAASGALDLPALRAGFAWLADQLLLDAEATRLQAFEIDRAEVAAERARFRGGLPAGAFERFLAATGWGEPELSAALSRALRVRRYLENRLPGHEADLDRAARALVEEVRRRSEVRVVDPRFLQAAAGEG